MFLAFLQDAVFSAPLWMSVANNWLCSWWWLDWPHRHAELRCCFGHDEKISGIGKNTCVCMRPPQSCNGTCPLSGLTQSCESHVSVISNHAKYLPSLHLKLFQPHLVISVSNLNVKLIKEQTNLILVLNEYINLRLTSLLF